MPKQSFQRDTKVLYPFALLMRSNLCVNKGKLVWTVKKLSQSLWGQFTLQFIQIARQEQVYLEIIGNNSSSKINLICHKRQLDCYFGSTSHTNFNKILYFSESLLPYPLKEVPNKLLEILKYSLFSNFSFVLSEKMRA